LRFILLEVGCKLIDDVGGIGGACVGVAGKGGDGIGVAGIGGADAGLEDGEIVGIVLFLRFEELLNLLAILEKILLPEDLNI